MREIRMCQKSRVRKKKQQLLRFILDENENIIFDKKQNLKGRGFYINLSELKPNLVVNLKKKKIKFNEKVVDEILNEL